ncbi:MAG: methyltransferase domain-containing protein [Chitinophagaceae bacterium]|nr:MAG: methyltransferase domain-containing protein [Chitinophagaceae bacterium]
MNESLKAFLKRAGIYHGLHGRYRMFLLWLTIKRYRQRYARYQGSGFTCNFCNATYSRFVPEWPDAHIASAIAQHEVIAGYDEHVYCPNCMSKNRERLIRAVIADRIELRGKDVLHFSPEKNLFRFLQTQASVVTADISPGYYLTTDTNVKQADATSLNFAEKSFDLIVANHILEHIPEDEKAMREFYRVLKPGGTAILQVPFSTVLNTTIEEPEINDPAKQEQLFGQRDHVRIYELNDYLRRLAAAGFETEPLYPQQLAKFQRFAVQEKEVVFLCHRAS